MFTEDKWWMDPTELWAIQEAHLCILLRYGLIGTQSNWDDGEPMVYIRLPDSVSMSGEPLTEKSSIILYVKGEISIYWNITSVLFHSFIQFSCVRVRMRMLTKYRWAVVLYFSDVASFPGKSKNWLEKEQKHSKQERIERYYCIHR